MSEYLVNSGDLVSVADAIRAKGETTEQLVFPGGFVAAIETMDTGKTGATLTVTTPAEGVTVTVTKGELSYTKTTGADGTAVFPGLESGTWTITISKGSQTATGSVDIDADYAAELTFFAATINVTYPKGLVCTATDGVTTMNAPDTSGTWTCTVHNAGTWTVSTDVSSADVTVTEKGQITSVTLPCYLYNNGDECTAVSGGWYGKPHPISEDVTGTTNVSVTRNTSNIVAMTTSGDGAGVFLPYKKVDVTNYTTLTFTGSLYARSSWAIAALYVWRDLGSSSAKSYIARVEAAAGSSSSKTINNATIDLSSVEGEVLVGFALHTNVTVTMKELKLT